MPLGDNQLETVIDGDADAGSGNRSLPVYPGEQPSKGELDKYIRDYTRLERPDVMSALRGVVPAKLAAETAEFDLYPCLRERRRPRSVRAR